MKRTFLLIIPVVIILYSLITQVAFGQTGSIIISGADEQVIHFPINNTDLNGLLSVIPDRFVIEFADNNNLTFLNVPSLTLINYLNNIPDRFIIEFGDANNLILLGFPTELIDDSAPPVISSVAHSAINNTTYKVKWNTNEFAICTIGYGTSSGNYNNYTPENLYSLYHEAILENLTVGSNIYFRITCTDQSGNTGQSGEFNFTVVETKYIFLPLLNK